MSLQQAMKMDLELVMQLLLEGDGCPMAARAVMSEGFPHVAVDPCSKRHRYHEEFMHLVQDTLQDAKWCMLEKQSSAEESSTVENEMSDLHMLSEKMAREKESAHDAFRTKVALLEEARSEVKKWEQEHKKVQATSENLEKDANDLKKELEQVSSIIDGSLRMLLDGGWEDDEMKTDSVEAVREYLVAIGVDTVLITAAPHALAITPERRAPFDKVTVEHIVEVLQEEKNKIEANVAKVAPDVELARAEALGVWAILDIAREKELQVLSDKHDADVAHKSSMQASEDARQVVDWVAAVRKLIAKQQLANNQAKQCDVASAETERIKDADMMDKDVMAATPSLSPDCALQLPTPTRA